MAKKKVSETLLEQRKAREEFLKLKKMQSGEVAISQETDRKIPKTFKEKLQNFWFYYKVHTISIICTILILIVAISQCSQRTNWDMRVIYFSYTPVLDEQLKPIGTYFQKLSKDLNGDGEINIQIINCSLTPGDKTSQYNRSVLTKVQALIAAEEEALLYITDSESAEYFNAEALGDFFQTEQLKLGDSFYRQTKNIGYDPLPDGLQIALRRVSGTVIEERPNVDKIYKESESILEKLKENG